MVLRSHLLTDFQNSRSHCFSKNQWLASEAICRLIPKILQAESSKGAFLSNLPSLSDVSEETLLSLPLVAAACCRCCFPVSKLFSMIALLSSSWRLKALVSSCNHVPNRSLTSLTFSSSSAREIEAKWMRKGEGRLSEIFQQQSYFYGHGFLFFSLQGVNFKGFRRARMDLLLALLAFFYLHLPSCCPTSSSFSPPTIPL